MNLYSLNNQHTICLASAGCGKTYALVQNYVEKAQELSTKEQNYILALTFSEKAALEMQTRIKSQLLVNNMTALNNITTFHSFCANFIKEYGHYENIFADFSIILPHEEQLIAKDLLSSIILQEIEHNFLLKQLIKYFKLDNTNLSSGLLEQIYNFYTNYKEQGLSIDKLQKNLSFIDCKNKLNQAYSNFKIVIDKSILEATKATKYKALGLASCLEQIADYQSLEPAKINLILDNMNNFIKGNFAYKKFIIEEKNYYLACLYQCIMFAYEEEIINIIKKFNELFINYKKTRNLVSYTDLLLITKKLLCNSKVRNNFKPKIAHILVDEYQDTSSLQEDIVFLLLSNEHKDFDKFKNIAFDLDTTNISSFFIVGDKKQSIYSFRGAKVNLLNNLTNKFSDAQVINLSVNRRSGKNILDLVNLVSKYALKEQNYNLQEDLLAHSLEASFCNLLLSDDKDAYYTAALGVKKLLLTQKPKNITILLRRIKPANLIKQHLQKWGIAVKIIGAEGFFNRHEIIEILCAFKSIFEPLNTHITLTLLRSPFILLSDNDILAIHLFLNDSINIKNLKDNLKSLPIEKDAQDRLINFFSITDNIAACFALKPLVFHMHEMLSNTDFLSYYTSDKEQVMANINKLSGMMSAQNNPYETLYDLWQQMQNNAKESQGLIDVDAVSIMTIHQAKGLEFDTVILADLESSIKVNKDLFIYDEKEGFFMRPKGVLKALKDNKYLNFTKLIKQKQQEQYAEEARLLYVAMTRAKHHLYFACSDKSRYRNNLLNLLLLAKKHEEAYFNELCPTVKLKEEEYDCNNP